MFATAKTFQGAQIGRLVFDKNAMDICLNRGELFTLGHLRKGTRLVCQSGHLWITQKGDQDDHMLSADEAFIVTRPGRIVVQAMPGGSLHIAA